MSLARALVSRPSLAPLSRNRFINPTLRPAELIRTVTLLLINYFPQKPRKPSHSAIGSFRPPNSPAILSRKPSLGERALILLPMNEKIPVGPVAPIRVPGVLLIPREDGRYAPSSFHAFLLEGRSAAGKRKTGRADRPSRRKA